MKVILVLALMLCAVVVFASLAALGLEAKETWTTVAAALAVTTAIISAWTAQQVLELQQKALLPDCYPTIDVASRYGLVQLRVTNFGGSVARNIRLDWDKPLLNSKGKVVKFTEWESKPDIAILLPKESVCLLIDGAVDFFSQCKDLNWSGNISFEGADGVRVEQQFHLSAEKYQTSLSYSDEEPKTHFQLQKIPDEIRQLREEIKRLRSSIEKGRG